MSQNPTPAQLQALLQYASKRLGTTPDHLIQTVQNGGLESLASNLPAADSAKLKQLLQDKSQVEQLMNSPAARQLLEKALKNKP